MLLAQRILDGFRPTCKLSVLGCRTVLELRFNQNIKVYYVLRGDNVLLVMRGRLVNLLFNPAWAHGLRESVMLLRNTMQERD